MDGPGAAGGPGPLTAAPAAAADGKLYNTPFLP